MTEYKLVPVEPLRRALYALERFANDTLKGRNAADELRELLAAPPSFVQQPVDGAKETEWWRCFGEETREPFQPTADQFIATFRCENNGIVGTTNAKIHNVTLHDDGIIEVVIDHWPEQPVEQQPEVLAKGYFHPIPEENDYEFYDAEEDFPNDSDCPTCVPAVIVRNSSVANLPVEQREPCRTINIEDIKIDDIVAWAEGVQGALGTEYADRVTEMEAAASRAVMTAIASASDRCPHGVRRPHECKECADIVPASEALDWAEREFEAARQSSGEPGQVEESISVTYVDGVGAGRRSLSDCRDGVKYITVEDTVYWPLTPEETQRLRSAECGRGDFTGPGTPTNVAALVEALEWYSEQVLGCRKTTSEGEQYRTALDRDGGARARAALAPYRKQRGES